MRKSVALLLVLVLTASSIASVLPVKAEARTIVVPDDYATIPSAIQGASDGDTIFVKRGIYQEPTLEINKSLSIIGEDVYNTTLNLNPPLVEAFILRNWLWIPVAAITINADNVKLQGFTINIPRANYGFGGGLHATGDRMEVIANKIANNSVYLSGSSISVTDNSIAGTLEVIGSNQTIANNSIQESLKIQGSYNKIIGNRINSWFYLNGSFNFISENAFPTLEMVDSSSNLVIANSLRSLKLRESGHGYSDNLITKNKVTGNGGVNDGISVESGSNNTVSANTICGCESGLSLSGPVTKNSIYLNNFVNNSINIQYYGDADWTLNNRFDNGAKGNYYDDYKGADNNWDGVGDVPYTIRGTRWDNEAGGVVDAGFAQDRYPLMTPFDIDHASIELPEWASPLMNPSPEPQTLEPFPTTLVAASVITVAVIGIGLLLYFKKRRR